MGNEAATHDGESTMHLLDLEVDELSRRRGTVPLRQRPGAHQRELARGEAVVARDRRSGEYWHGVVHDLDAGSGERWLRVGLHHRLPTHVALARVADPPSARGTDGLDELRALVRRSNLDEEAPLGE